MNRFLQVYFKLRTFNILMTQICQFHSSQSKVIHVFNSAPWREDIWMNGFTVPCIHNLDTR
jgi:hypothetical protein